MSAYAYRFCLIMYKIFKSVISRLWKTVLIMKLEILRLILKTEHTNTFKVEKEKFSKSALKIGQYQHVVTTDNPL